MKIHLSYIVKDALMGRFHSKNMNMRKVAIFGSAIMVLGGVYGYERRYSKTQPTTKDSNHQTMDKKNKEESENKPDKDKYLVHEGIIATVFWVGEGANSSNDNIHNRSSAWSEDWVKQFGGIDNPDDRCGYSPCSFSPKENMFYFALPYNDYNESGSIRSHDELKVIPWFDGKVLEGQSVVKNRWIEIMYNSKKAYAQWEDAGPFGENDTQYVFGSASPKEKRAGLDISPATADYLGIKGRDTVSWRFVEAHDVPDGPWKQIITTSSPSW